MGLHGILYVARAQGASDGELIDLIEEELRRSDQFVSYLHALPRGDASGDAPLSLIEAIRQAVAANGLNRLTAIRITSSDRPFVVRAPRHDLVRTLLLLILATADNRASAEHQITIEVDAADDYAIAKFSTREAKVEDRIGRAAVQEALDAARGFGGSIQAVRSEGTFTAVLAMPLVTLEAAPGI